MCLHVMLICVFIFWFYSGAKRNYNTNRYDDGSGGPPKREFNRSLSSENWRDRGGNEEEEEDGDWRRAGGSKWSKWWILVRGVTIRRYIDCINHKSPRYAYHIVTCVS